MGFIILQTDTDAVKKNVYITGSLKDAAWFEQIANDVLDYQDCIVYMADEFGPGEDTKKECNYLKDMELVILIITKSFLLEESRAKDIEFQKLKELRIPILPIMVEEGLEELFDSVCGNLHLLNQKADSYRWKLSEHLQRVFVNTRLQEAMRDSFSGECFLSYRKKDREDALELLHAIHQKEEYRDLAIWFDDFLVMGEDYDDEIDEHLVKSEFVLLVVTPSLLEEGNYVMDIEYPRAVELNKKIIPVELFPTEQSLLAEMYPGLPECIPFYEEYGREKLFQQIQQVRWNGKRNDPEKDYLQGLAYIRGINAEKNFEYGVEKLKNAARAGYLKACKELGYIYMGAYHGRVDYAEALIWLEKYVDSVQGELIENLGEAWEADLASVLRDLCDANMALGRAELAKNALRELYQLNTRFSDIWQSDSSVGIAYVYIKAGTICYEEKKYGIAMQCFSKAEEEIETLLKFRQGRMELTMRSTLLHMQEKLYDALYKSEQNPECWKISIQYLEEYVNALKELLIYGIKADYYELYYALHRLGDAYFKIGKNSQNLEDMSCAQLCMKEAYDLICFIADKVNRNMIGELFKTAQIYSNITVDVAVFYENQEKVQQALSYYQESYEMLDILYKKMPDDVTCRENRDKVLQTIKKLSENSPNL